MEIKFAIKIDLLDNLYSSAEEEERGNEEVPTVKAFESSCTVLNIPTASAASAVGGGGFARDMF